MHKIEPVTTWRVVNEDPSESYISVDDEFMNETINPTSTSMDQKLLQNPALHPKKNNSVERKNNIKLSVLTAIKKTKGHMRKQNSTSRVLDDIERTASSPLLQHAMSAFFNTTKAPPTGPKSIRMSSNASVLYPIREEGCKMSIQEDVLSEVESSPRSSISKGEEVEEEEKALKDSRLGMFKLLFLNTLNISLFFDQVSHQFYS